MLSPRQTSRERLIVLGGIAIALVIISLLVFVVGKKSVEPPAPEELTQLTALRSRIPSASQLEQAATALDTLATFLLQHRSQGGGTHQTVAAVYDEHKPIVASAVRFEDPGIGSALVLRWEFPVTPTADRKVIVFRSRSPGTLGDRVATLSSTARHWVDWDVEHSISFAYSVQALTDGMDPEALALQSVGQAFDRLPPQPPENVQVITSGAPPAVRITWELPADADIVGVNVYRSQEPAKLGDKVATKVAGKFWEDATVGGGTRYYYTVTSLDHAGNESSARLTPAPLHRDDPFTPVAPPPAAPESKTPVKTR